MKIALTHDHLFQVGGAEKVLLELHKIFPDSPIYTLIKDAKAGELFKDLDIRTSFLQNWLFSHKHFKWYLGLMPMAWEKMVFNDYDVVISSASAFAKGILTPPNTLHICYCHSPIRYLWSDSREYVAELKLPWLVKKGVNLLLHRLRLWDYVAAQRVDRFIANSHFVGKRIKKYYQRDSFVIYPPVTMNKNFNPNEKIENYYVIVSRLRPYKKVDVAIRAFNQLHIPLKIIGTGEELNYLKSIAKDNIEFLGELNDVERDKVISHAKAFIHPQEEDFGIAAVEAMSCGRPVIAYGSGGALETVKDGVTGRFFYEQTWESLSDVILRFQQEADKFDPQTIRSWAETFSPERFRQEILDFVEKSREEFLRLR
jgi:glycosyltransferase involved in cell wall biosynthesis